MRRLAFFLMVCLLFTLWSNASEITIGSFKIEWFGVHSRTDEQIRLLADYIRSLDIDILACQQISPTCDKSKNGTPDWNDLLRELGSNFAGWHGSTCRPQRLAFIWRTDRVEVTDLGELKAFKRQEIRGTEERTFPPNSNHRLRAIFGWWCGFPHRDCAPLFEGGNNPVR